MPLPSFDATGLSLGLGENGDVIGSARCQRRVKGKVAVGGNGLIVSAVVLQDEAAADEAGHTTANGDRLGLIATGDNNVGDSFGRHCADAVFDDTDLSLGLGENGDVIRSARCQRRVKGKFTVGVNGLIVTAVVLQNEAAADEAGDGTANGDRIGRGTGQGEGGKDLRVLVVHIYVCPLGCPRRRHHLSPPITRSDLTSPTIGTGKRSPLYPML